MIQSYEILNAAQEISETDPFTLDRYKQFYQHFPNRAETLLDIGCNTGRGGAILKELNNNLNLVGLDCLQERIDKIPSGIYNNFICSYSTNIESADSYFDVIVAGEFIEHLYIKDVEPTLREFYRILKSKGKLLLTTPNPDYIRLKLTGGSVLGGAHLSQHYPKVLKKQLAEIGFVNIHILGSGKMSRFLGEQFPLLCMYGSYLVVASK